MPDGSTVFGSQAPEGLTDKDEASTTESEAAAVRRMHEATQKESQALRDNEMLRKELDEVKQQAAIPPETDPFDDEEFLEGIRDDPSKIGEYVKSEVQRVRGDFANVLKSLVSEVRGEIQSVSPEYVRYQPLIEELRKEQWTQGFSDDQLMAVAKRDDAMTTTKRKSRVVTAPTGNRSSVMPGTEEVIPVDDMDAVKKSEAFTEMWGEEIDDLQTRLDAKVERLKNG
jgi:hypothetical protein